jgi:hypothetical protein
LSGTSARGGPRGFEIVNENGDIDFTLTKTGDPSLFGNGIQQTVAVVSAVALVPNSGQLSMRCGSTRNGSTVKDIRLIAIPLLGDVVAKNQ